MSQFSVRFKLFTSAFFITYIFVFLSLVESAISVGRYICKGKPTIIAKLYLSYLDNKLTWEEFTIYSEMTDQLFMNDLDFLRKEEAQIIQDISSAAALRLTSLGLLFEVYEKN